MKRLQNNFTTKEQSKQLLELGVPTDSADCLIYEKPYYTIHVRRKGKRPHSHKKGIPCCTVGRLIEIYELCTGCYYKDISIKHTLIEKVLYQLERAIKCNGIDLSKLEECMNEKLKCKDCEFYKHGRCESYDVAAPLNGECYNW